LKSAFYFELQVIYGDTDSIMIYSGLDDIPKAKAIAGKVIQEVKLWSCTLCLLEKFYVPYVAKTVIWRPISIPC
jgi:DNA polymerase elongation subunit (family B)